MQLFGGRSHPRLRRFAPQITKDCIPCYDSRTSDYEVGIRVYEGCIPDYEPRIPLYEKPCTPDYEESRCIRGLGSAPVSYTHLRAHETDSYLVCRLLLETKKKQ